MHSENCTQHRKNWQSSWNRWFPKMKAVTGAAVWEKGSCWKQHTVRDALETDQKLIISDENVDRMLPSIYSMPDALFFAKQDAGLMADRFIRQHDCSVADNDQ